MCSHRLTSTGAILCSDISQEALRGAPHSGVAGLHRPGGARDEGLWKSHWCVRVDRLGQQRCVRSEGLVVQGPWDAQVASVLVHTAHFSPACIWQGPALIHIWNTEPCTDKEIPSSRTSVSLWFMNFTHCWFGNLICFTLHFSLSW